MTRDTRFNGEITTSEAFLGTLTALVRVAHTNGVDVSGAWECRIAFDSRPARKVRFTLDEDGRAKAIRPLIWNDPPWFPIEVERIENPVEKEPPACAAKTM